MCFLPAEKHASLGGAKARMSVYTCINENILKFVTRIQCDCLIGYAFQLDNLYNQFETNVVILFVYLPPNASPFYKNKRLKFTELLGDNVTNISNDCGLTEIS